MENKRKEIREKGRKEPSEEKERKGKIKKIERNITKDEGWREEEMMRK